MNPNQARWPNSGPYERLQGAPQYFHQSGNMYPQGNWVNQQNVHNRMNFQFNGGQGLWQPQNLHFQRPRNIQFVNRTEYCGNTNLVLCTQHIRQTRGVLPVPGRSLVRTAVSSEQHYQGRSIRALSNPKFGDCPNNGKQNFPKPWHKNKKSRWDQRPIEHQIEEKASKSKLDQQPRLQKDEEGSNSGKNLNQKQNYTPHLNATASSHQGKVKESQLKGYNSQPKLNSCETNSTAGGGNVSGNICKITVQQREISKLRLLSGKKQLIQKVDSKQGSGTSNEKSAQHLESAIGTEKQGKPPDKPEQKKRICEQGAKGQTQRQQISTIDKKVLSRVDEPSQENKCVDIDGCSQKQTDQVTVKTILSSNDAPVSKNCEGQGFADIPVGFQEEILQKASTKTLLVTGNEDPSEITEKSIETRHSDTEISEKSEEVPEATETTRESSLESSTQRTSSHFCKTSISLRSCENTELRDSSIYISNQEISDNIVETCIENLENISASSEDGHEIGESSKVKFQEELKVCEVTAQTDRQQIQPSGNVKPQELFVEDITSTTENDNDCKLEIVNLSGITGERTTEDQEMETDDDDVLIVGETKAPDVLIVSHQHGTDMKDSRACVTVSNNMEVLTIDNRSGSMTVSAIRGRTTLSDNRGTSNIVLITDDDTVSHKDYSESTGSQSNVIVIDDDIDDVKVKEELNIEEFDFLLDSSDDEATKSKKTPHLKGEVHKQSEQGSQMVAAATGIGNLDDNKADMSDSVIICDDSEEELLCVLSNVSSSQRSSQEAIGSQNKPIRSSVEQSQASKEVMDIDKDSDDFDQFISLLDDDLGENYNNDDETVVGKDQASENDRSSPKSDATIDREITSENIDILESREMTLSVTAEEKKDDIFSSGQREDEISSANQDNLNPDLEPSNSQDENVDPANEAEVDIGETVNMEDIACGQCTPPIRGSSPVNVSEDPKEENSFMTSAAMNESQERIRATSSDEEDVLGLMGETEDHSDERMKSDDVYFVQDDFLDASHRSVLVLSDDSSDDDLFGVDSVFNNLKTLSVRAAPSTPTKLMSHDPGPSVFTPVGSDEEDTLSTMSGHLDTIDTAGTSQINLDTLLQDKLKRDQEKEDGRQIDDLKAQADNSQTEESDDDGGYGELMEEHKIQLEKYKVQDNVIMDQHPGEIIFDPQLYLQIFNENISPAECGFIGSEASSDMWENKISTLPQDVLTELLRLGVFTHSSFTNPGPFYTWILHLLSVHRNDVVIDKCEKLLYHYIQYKKGPDWVPTLTDICRIFVNYGCTCENLYPKFTISNLKFQDDSSQNRERVARGNNCYGFHNMQAVTRVLTTIFKHRHSLYSSENLVDLIIILLKVSLDRRLYINMLRSDFYTLISVLVEVIPADQWEEACRSLCSTLPHLCGHHHNLVYVSEMFSHTTRGRAIQRRVSLNAMQLLLDQRQNCVNSGTNVKLTEVLETVNSLVLKNNTDYYRISSLLALLELSVGNEGLRNDEKDDLVTLKDRVRSLTGDIRDSVGVLDRTLIKDKIVRLTSKWQFMLLNMGTKQSTLFDWALRSQDDEFNVETVGGGEIEGTQRDVDES